MKLNTWRYTLILIALAAVAVGLLPYLMLSLPDPAGLAGASDPAGLDGSPSTQRAVQRIAALSASTRTPGAPNHDAARDALAAELRALGLEVEIQPAAVDGLAAPLENVLARRRGQGPAGRALLLMAHYDSDPASPGAFDNASGVAVVMEIARALAAEPAPANDLIVLLTDGEELGVLGAPEFIDHHPWAKDVRVALNFDSLTTGPVFLWQTGANNGWLVRRYADTPRPMAASWIDGISRVMPLDTDLRPFLEAGITGGSFTTPYLPPQGHTPLDQPHLVRAVSLRHGIQQGTALARRLLQDDLSAPSAPDRAYLNPWGSWFISYPASLAAGMGLLAGLGALGIAAARVARKAVGPGAVGRGALFTAANMLFGALLVLAIELVIFFRAPMLSPWVRIPLEIGLFGLLLALGYRRLARRIPPAALLLGAQLVWGVLAAWSALADPLFSPVLTLILLASLALHLMDLPRLSLAARRAVQAAVLAVILLLGAPVVLMLFMISGMIWIPAMLGAMAVALLVGLAAPLLALDAGSGHAA